MDQGNNLQNDSSGVTEVGRIGVFGEKKPSMRKIN